ncbi:SAV_915 family protein [Streptomyces sp. NPDC048196]|uniref:SAV_915 family protein n=1 Tax=Streptomyces sp. NPDC048196 TaxID=3154712 RepID=UPI0033C48802
MSHHLYAEDPEPSDRIPAGPLFVPVRSGPAGCTARLFRTPLGGRTAVGFTSAQRLAAALGGGQPWVRLSEPALRALAEPLGATALTVDPRLTPEASHTTRAPGAPRVPQAARTAGASHLAQASRTPHLRAV